MVEGLSSAQMNICDRLHQIRKNLGMKQAEFSEKLGVTFQTISRYERGVRIPDGEFMLSLRNKLNVSIDWLLTGVGDPYAGTTPYIPALLESCVVGTVMTFEQEGREWTLKRLAKEINDQYVHLLPEYASGQMPIVDMDDATIEALRRAAPSSRLA